jgi:hypothetical protein
VNLLTLNLLAGRGGMRVGLSRLHPGAKTARLRGLRRAPLTFELVMSADQLPARGTPSVDRSAAASHSLDYGLDSVIDRGVGLREHELPAQGHLAPGERLNQPLRLSSVTSVPVGCRAGSPVG